MGRSSPLLTGEVQKLLNRCEHPSGRIAIIGIQGAASRHATAAHEPAREACSLVPYSLPALERFRASDELHLLVWGDLERIKHAAATAGGWTDDTPVSPDFFGVLWPSGIPSWFDATNPAQPEEDDSDPFEDLPPARLKSPDPALPPAMLAALRALAEAGARIRFRGPADRDTLDHLFSGADRSTGIDEFRWFYGAHDGAVLDMRKACPEAGCLDPIHILPLGAMPAAHEELISWDCTRVWFDQRVCDEENEYMRNVVLKGVSGFEARSLGPYRREDVLVFAKAEMNADCWFTVLRGPLTGKVIYFDHETGSTMDTAVASGLTDFFLKLPDWLNDPELLLG